MRKISGIRGEEEEQPANTRAVVGQVSHYSRCWKSGREKRYEEVGEAEK